MLIPLIGGYMMGGVASGIVFSVVYCIYLAQHRRRLPWSGFLGFGWLLCIIGTGMMIVSQPLPGGRDSWQSYWGMGGIGVAFGCWWLCVLVYAWPRFLTWTEK